MKNWMIMLLLLSFSISIFAQETGTASYYAEKFNGRKTASGILHNNENFVAAHRKLPFGTFVKVTNLSNSKSVIVQITDRGPYYGKRLIDLSRSAAERIGMVQNGLQKVQIDVIGHPSDLYIARMLDLKPLPFELVSFDASAYVPSFSEFSVTKDFSKESWVSNN